MLLKDNGEIHILKSWIVREATVKPKWFSSTKKMSYVYEIELTDTKYHLPAQATHTSAIGIVNKLIGERNRYLALQRSLKGFGCTIVSRKISGDDREINKTQCKLSSEDS